MRFALLTVAVALLCVFAQALRFDLIVTGGRIVDGSGNPWSYADLGIKGDSIEGIPQYPGWSYILPIA